MLFRASEPLIRFRQVEHQLKLDWLRDREV
jgi:hypothetical protein